ncbi:MAG: NnrU family protein [Phenylobacterium sp.]
MIQLVLAAAAFLLIHLCVSGTPLRDRLVARLGEGAYLGLFSLASAGILVWLIVAHGAARVDPLNISWWGVTPATRHIQYVVILVAFLIAVPGLLARNPGTAGQANAMDDPETVKGVLRITRHPFLWGVGLWAAGHLMVNGDLASLILFGSLGVLGLGGAASIDAKRRRIYAERWSTFEGRTSFIPFAAILTGRQPFKPAELAVPALIGLIVYTAVLFGHRFIAGVPALG